MADSLCAVDLSGSSARSSLSGRAKDTGTAANTRTWTQPNGPRHRTGVLDCSGLPRPQHNPALPGQRG